MIRRAQWYPALSHMVVVWEESGENLALFCYFMGWGALAMLRAHVVAPILSSKRLETVCSNPSSTFSVNSITPKGSEN
jgi:hypothetical protein